LLEDGKERSRNAARKIDAAQRQEGERQVAGNATEEPGELDRRFGR